jgi:hypothetical protein
MRKKRKRWMEPAKELGVILSEAKNPTPWVVLSKAKDLKG